MKLDDISEITGSWDYSSLPSNIVLGKDCWFEREDSFGRFRSEHQPGLTFGDRVKVYTWTTFNIEPTGKVSVGNDSILVGAVFMCAELIDIGQRVVVSYNVTIADSDFHPFDIEDRRKDAIANSPEGDRTHRPPIISIPTFIEDNVFIGIGAIILKGVRVGRGAQIGAGSVVTADVPPGATVHGNPAIIV